jgi:tetratricopeptide (TPR) repeat protein
VAPGNLFGELLLKIATPILVQTAKAGLGALAQRPPVSKAIEATAASFPFLPALGFTLGSWCESQAFLKILEDVKDGRRDFSQDAVIDSFIKVGGFFAEDDTHVLAQQVLESFLIKLEQNLYGSKDGLFLHARREEMLHEDQQVTLDRIDAGIAHLQADVGGLVQRLPPPDDTRVTRSEAERSWHAKVDAARDLVNQGRAQAARSILETLQRELINESASQELRFRVKTNLGACAMRLGEFEAASREYAAALTLQPNSPKALANAAMAKLVLDRPDEAIDLLRRARDLAPRDAHVASIHLQAIYNVGRLDELDELLKSESWIEEDTGCALALANIRYRQHRYGDAESFARRALHGGPDDVQAYLLLAEAIAAPIQHALREDPPLRWRLPVALRRRLKEAEAAYGCAVDLVDDGDNRRLLHQALTARAAVRAMLGSFEDALRDCDRVLAVDPSNERALRDRPLMLLQLNRRTEAIQGLERMQRDHYGDVVLATAYLDENAPDKAIALIAPRRQPGAGDEQQLEIVEILLNAYGLARKDVEAEALASAISETWPNDSEALSVLGRYRSRQGKAEEAIAIFREALAYATGHGRDRIALELARTYDLARRYSEAAELYREIVDVRSDNALARKYLAALYNAGSYRDALVLARRLRGDGDVIPMVSEIEALVMERIGDLDGAIGLLLRLSHIEPTNFFHRVRIALFQLRRGDRDAARITLSNIHVGDLSESHALLQVAQARSILRMPDVLSFAHRARRRDFGNPDVHLGYIQLFLEREKPDGRLLDVDRVAIDCTVQLRNGAELQTYTIIDDTDLDRERGELHPSDQLAQKLLGLPRGASVVLKQGPLEDLSYEVVDIKSKYVFAFQETLMRFSTWFPEHSGLYRMRTAEGDISKILRSLDARHDYANQVIDLYRAGHLSLGAFARLVGASVIDVWAGLVTMTKGVVLASTGLVADSEREASLLASTREIVLDLTALLTLAYLGLLARLPRRFDQLLVPQALLDDIDQTVAKNFLRAGPEMTVWKQGEQYFRYERTPEDRERDRQFIDGIRSFITQKCVITPTTAALELGRARLAELGDLLGSGALGAILLAKEYGRPLYSDDLGLRGVARNDWQAEGFWTQSLLVDLKSSGIINDDEYYSAVHKLLLGNYRFVSIDGTGLFRILQAAGFAASQETSRVLESLHGPDCTEDSAVFVLAELVRRCWMEPLLYHQKLSVLEIALRALTTGRSTDRALVRFKAALRERFALAPLVLRPIFDAIDVWGRRLNVEGALIRLE